MANLPAPSRSGVNHIRMWPNNAGSAAHARKVIPVPVGAYYYICGLLHSRPGHSIDTPTLYMPCMHRPGIHTSIYDPFDGWFELSRYLFSRNTHTQHTNSTYEPKIGRPCCSGGFPLWHHSNATKTKKKSPDGLAISPHIIAFAHSHSLTPHLWFIEHAFVSETIVLLSAHDMICS